MKAVRAAATRALGAIGPDALPALCAIATNQNIVDGQAPLFFRGGGVIVTNKVMLDTRLAALHGIGRMGTNAMSASLALIPCLNTNENTEIVVAALQALSQLRSRQRELFLPILECLDNPDPQVRRYAVDALAPLADWAMPALYRAVTDDTDPFVRARALEALASLGRRALPAIAQGLKDSNEHVRYTALEVLVNAAPRELTNAAVLAIGAEGLLRSAPGSGRRGTAALLLRAAGQEAQGAKPDLRFHSRDERDLLFAQATNALRQLAPALLTNALPWQGGPVK